jgi:hypothetical protein
LSRFLSRCLLLSLLFPSSIHVLKAQQAADIPNLTLGSVVVSGFSGTVLPDPSKALPRNTAAVDLTFIDPKGVSAEIIDLSRPGKPWDASLLPAPKTFKVTAALVGQVFGVAIGDQQRPNIYLSATSAYGLHIVRRAPGGQTERLKTGGPGAQWAEGQFGIGLQGGPGSVYVVDGGTGAVSLLANVMLDGVPNPGPGLGNIAFDGAHKQLFVSDLYTGMIHRIGLDGADLGHLDHGVSVRSAAQLAPVAFDPRRRLVITNSQFAVDNPQTWGFAAPPRQVWAVTLRHDRLYYSVGEGPQIWSIGIQPDGNFASDARLEAEIPPRGSPMPVTDIAFSAQGAMIVAQRGAPGSGFYNYSAFTRPGEPQVLRFVPKRPGDPPSPGLWNPQPQESPVGFAGSYRNSNGGVAFSYGYDANGALNATACDATLLATGERLRVNPALSERLSPGGPQPVDGLQIGPSDAVLDVNAPPWTSYFADYDDTFDGKAATGSMGSVRAFTMPCAGQIASSGGGAANPPYVSGPQGGGGGGGGGCIGPDCPPPPPNACFASTGAFECNPVTGQWVYKLSVNGPGWINSVSAVSLTSGVSVPGGTIPLNPATIPVSGKPGSSAVIEICVFNATAAASGKPYDCCRTRVNVTIPTRACGIRR